MHISRRGWLAACTLAGSFALSTAATADIITTSLGNTSSGFTDGDTPTTAEVGAVQGGQPAPFDQGYGTDGLFGGDFEQTWNFVFGPITDPIIAASISFGIVDHDSSASGSQLALFTVDGNNLTATLDVLFEAGGGSLDLEYNVFTVDLAGLFGDLVDGSVSVALNLAGPGLVTPLFPLPGPNPPEETATNGANLIFSTLTIETRGDVQVAEPGTLPLLLSVLAILFCLSKRRRLQPSPLRRH